MGYYNHRRAWAAWQSDRDRPADVFFIHPTTYLCANHGNCAIMVDLTAENRRIMEKNTEPLNASREDAALNRYTDRTTLAHQARVFETSCRVFMPRYRQVHVKAFFLEPDDRTVRQAFDLAYHDVREAFLHYLETENRGRPIIIAGHSQGSCHGIRLLREFFDGTALTAQLIMGCLPGFNLPDDAFSQLPYLKSPEAFGGVIGWQSFQERAAAVRPAGTSFCVNPLTFTDTEQAVTAGDDCGITTGGEAFGRGMQVRADRKQGCLWVTLPPGAPEAMGHHANLHVYDYSLFYYSLRANVATRLKNWQAAQTEGRV